jgi:hypothetical protein
MGHGRPAGFPRTPGAESRSLPRVQHPSAWRLKSVTTDSLARGKRGRAPRWDGVGYDAIRASPAERARGALTLALM